MLVVVVVIDNCLVCYVLIVVLVDFYKLASLLVGSHLHVLLGHIVVNCASCGFGGDVDVGLGVWLVWVAG
jgi:hypothetical protein